MGSSVVWVYSTLLIQLRVPNQLQGRMMALEMAAYVVRSCPALELFEKNTVMHHGVCLVVFFPLCGSEKGGPWQMVYSLDVLMCVFRAYLTSEIMHVTALTVAGDPVITWVNSSCCDPHGWLREPQQLDEAVDESLAQGNLASFVFLPMTERG